MVGINSTKVGGTLMGELLYGNKDKKDTEEKKKSPVDGLMEDMVEDAVGDNLGALTKSLNNEETKKEVQDASNPEGENPLDQQLLSQGLGQQNINASVSGDRTGDAARKAALMGR